MTETGAVSAAPQLLDALALAWQFHVDDLTGIWREAAASAATVRAQPEFAPLLADRTDRFTTLVAGAQLERDRISTIASAFRKADGGALATAAAVAPFSLTDDAPPPATPPRGAAPATPASGPLAALRTASPVRTTRRSPARSTRHRLGGTKARTHFTKTRRPSSTTTVANRARRQARPTASSTSTPQLPMARLLDQRQQLVAVAASQLGYRERSGNRTAYGAWFGLDGNPWCAMFVSWCLAAAGNPLPSIDGPRGAASVADLRRWARRTGRTANRAQPGDLLLIDHGNGKGHVGIVERVDPDGTIHTIEGNTDPRGSANGVMVARRVRPLTRHTVIVRP